ncbi:type I restriction endonuclease [Pedobacter sp. ASV28]|uniref:type I restriction endonuclease n=1 Tax=Pedobacter sp. ASV28 TaxID=2795123 RepID=UPI0018EAF2E8|nr:type I restriction endonuclease [Pedobacter sp. ASV28]
MNENEFEQHLSHALRTIMPTLQPSQIKTQQSFTVKFGRNRETIEAGGKNNKTRQGIYDLLLCIDGRPLVMLELKKPGSVLSDEDRDQGISYARLTDDITPVTIITNGVDFRIYDTYTKDEIKEQYLDGNFFSKRLQQAASLAKNEFKQSVITLIENDQRILFKLFNKITDTAFNDMIGKADNMRKPIINDFCIEREILPILRKLVRDHQFVVLSGDAYIGKTNLLYQYYLEALKNEEAVLYVNCLDFNYSIFRKLTNSIHSELKFPIDEIKLKEWLLLNFDQSKEKKVTIIFDHLRYNIDPVIMADISELVDIFRMDGNNIIISADKANYVLLKGNEDRKMNTFFGNTFKEIELGAFSTEEFHRANNISIKNYNITFAWGAVYSDIYRLPHIWRMLLGNEAKAMPDNHYGIFKAVPSIEFLDVFRKNYQLAEQPVSDFLLLVGAFFDTVAEIESHSLKLIAHNLGIIAEEKALQRINEKKIDKLILAGYLERRIVTDFKWVLVVKQPELLAAFATSYLLKNYLPLLNLNFAEGYKKLLSDCEYLPYGELVVGDFIKRLGSIDIEMYNLLFNELLKDAPIIKTHSGPMDVNLFINKVGIVRVQNEEDIENTFYSNLFPYLVLSHLLNTNFMGEDEDPYYIRFQLIYDIADKPFLLRKADRTFFHDGIESINIGRLGSFLKGNIGILEPITQAIYDNLLILPKYIQDVFDAAVENEKYHLVHRIYIAAQNAITMQAVEGDILEICDYIVNDYKKALTKIIALGITDENASEEEVEQLRIKIEQVRGGGGKNNVDVIKLF